MSGSTYKGMNTYNRILQDARMEGKPIGAKHHLHDRQLKEWVRDNAQKLQALKETRTARTIETKTGLKTKIAQKAAMPTKPTLRDRYEQEQRAKIAKGYETPDWQRSTDAIPSRGNGL